MVFRKSAKGSNHGVNTAEAIRSEHPGNIYDAFWKFVDHLAYEYEAVAKAPLTGTDDVAAWTALDQRKQSVPWTVFVLELSEGL